MPDSTGRYPVSGLLPRVGITRSLNAAIVGMVPTVDDNGYFIVAADGGVFTFGDAKFEGSSPSIGGCPGGAAVAVMPDGAGNGYSVVTAGGYVTAFGDAPSPGEPAVHREWSQRYGATTAVVTTSSTRMAWSTAPEML